MKLLLDKPINLCLIIEAVQQRSWSVFMGVQGSGEKRLIGVKLVMSTNYSLQLSEEHLM